MKTDFEHIKAYDDINVNSAIKEILNDKDFINRINQNPDILKIFKIDGVQNFIDKFLNIHTVKDFQKIMFKLLDTNIELTTDGLSFSMDENLNDKNKILFISNHRSTSLDSAYLNYILRFLNLETVYSGAGDNIFETKWLGHLIRLNKGFIIKRNVEDIDDKIAQAKLLSGYINYLLEQNKTVWITQKPGRSKDGIDKTDSVIITMLNKYNENLKYSDWLKKITLLPICVSWEIIPCADFMVKETIGNSIQEPFVDRNNILHEIGSFKGRVHYHFGKRIFGEKRKEIVNNIDEQILSNYILWDTNLYAFLENENLSKKDKNLITANIDINRAKSIFEKTKLTTNKEKRLLLDMYANPVREALKLSSSLENVILKSNKLKENANSVILH